MKGKVIKCVKNNYTVSITNGQLFKCKLKSSERLKERNFTNPISVGDFVDFSIDDNNEINIINNIYPRKNYVIRKSVNLSFKSQILASNIDYVFLIVTIKNPVTSLLFIDRYLTTTNAFKIPTILIFNKNDIYNEDDIMLEKKYFKIYKGIVADCISMSALNLKKLKSLEKYLKNKTILLSGHSGVGKSTLINSLDPSFKLTTREISEKYKQGTHTTTFSEMLFLKKYKLSIIDSPGIRGFGLVDINKNDLPNYFPDFVKYASDCKFRDCLHIKEPKCAIRNHVNNGSISKSRYENYLKMLDESKAYRRGF